jgi:hypothetical protein
LIIETFADVNVVKLVVKVSFKAVFDDLKNGVRLVTFAFD